ncbi:hypothetical protein B0H17DRAFT_1140969 [Mycena rosella]|uniref:Uncharacterized protein n=1 Tax=Mycena rosella TaxID=1033263 RepID=A0AAD7D4I9_MYCRO|nr:hypothetical protein B0H17DRAFT_1140969 [Mycena rosella]
MCVGVSKAKARLRQWNNTQNILLVEELVSSDKPKRCEVVVDALLVHCHVNVQRIELEECVLQGGDREKHLRVRRGQHLQLFEQHEKLLNELAEKRDCQGRGFSTKLSAAHDDVGDEREEWGELVAIEAPEAPRDRTADMKVLLARIPPHHVQLGTGPLIENQGQMAIEQRELLGPESGVVQPIAHVRAQEDLVRDLQQGDGGDIVRIGWDVEMLRPDLSVGSDGAVKGPQRAQQRAVSEVRREVWVLDSCLDRCGGGERALDEGGRREEGGQKRWALVVGLRRKWIACCARWAGPLITVMLNKATQWEKK